MARLPLLIICASMLASTGCRRAVPMPEEPETGDPYEIIHALEVLRVKLDFDEYDHITRAGFVGTDITDEDLKLLIGLKHIDQLNLIGTDITDRGLRYLGQVKGVRYMFLDKTNITQEGVWQLEKDIPGTRLLTVYWDRGDADPKEPPKVYEYAEDLKDKTKPVHVHPVTITPEPDPKGETPSDEKNDPKKPVDNKTPDDGETSSDKDGKQPTSDKKDDTTPADGNEAKLGDRVEDSGTQTPEAKDGAEPPTTDVKPKTAPAGDAAEAPAGE